MSTKKPLYGTGLGTMPLLRLFSGVVVLVASLSVLATMEMPARGTGQMPAVETSHQPSLGTAGFYQLGIVDLSPKEIAEADRPTCMGLSASAVGIGTDGDDVITGTAGPDVIVAGAGNDVIYGRDGKDTICGGPGDDTLVGGRNPADWSNQRRGDRLSGGTGNDRIIDRYGFADKLIGGSGDDRLSSSNGWGHKVVGGPGADRLISKDVYDNAMLGGRGPDVLTALSGGGIGRYHSGGPGRDVIDVGPTGDIGVELAGDGDQLRVHDDSSVVLGFWGSPVGVEVDMATGTARRIGATPTDPADVITLLAPEADIWILYGSTHGDLMNGTDGHDTFFAHAGNDTLYGNGGGDSLHGFGGDDFIDGGDGEDSADGGRGIDTCIAEGAHKCER